MVKHRHRQASNHNPCATCNGAPPLLRRQHLPAPDSNPCFSAGDDLFLTGSATSRTPVSLRVADGQSQSPRPAMSFPHPLPSAPSRLPRLSPLTIPALPLALSVQLPVPVPRTLRCAVRYVSTCLPPPSPPRQVGNLPGYVPYLSPACHLVPLTQSRRIFHPMALLSPSTVAARSCLVSSRLVCPPTQWHPALFVAGSPLSGHGSVMGDGGCGCRRGRASFRRVLHAPPGGPVTRKKDQPFSGQALSCHLIGSVQGLQTVCAACPLLISSSFQRSPVFPRLHVQTKPVSDRRRFSLKSSSPTTLILAHKIPVGFGCFPTPSYPMISQKRALMFQCWNTHIMLRTQYRTDAADCAPSRGLDAACLLWRPGRSLPRVPCEHMELGLARMRAGERTSNESC